MVNVPSGLNNLTPKADDLDVDMLKTILVYLKKWSDKVSKEVVKNKKFNTSNAKVNNLEKKIPDATNLIHINQYNTDEQNFEKKENTMLIDVGKKIPNVSGLVATTTLNTKIVELDNKIPYVSGLVTTTVLNTKIAEVQNKVPDHDKHITTPEFNIFAGLVIDAKLQ